MIFIATDINKTIVIRKSKENGVIMLTPSNFDKYINGRSLSIHSCMGKDEEFGIIDIDTDDFIKAKEAVYDVCNTMDQAPFVNDIKVRFTGKDSFHVICYFKRKLRIDASRDLIRSFLKQSYISKIYTIEFERQPQKVNLDLAPNKYRGGYITKGSLSTLGLRCMEIELRHVRSFNKQMALIETKK
jgi:hypothetical protein